MSCGCAKTTKPNPALMHTRAAMCVLCVGASASHCPYSKATIQMHVNGQPCPKRRHPDRDGLVKWMGALWFGVPFPLRVWLWTTEYADREWGEFKGKLPGCGCIVALKTRWERMKARILVSDH